MTTPNEVVTHLAELARQLDAAVRELARLDNAAVQTRCRYEVEFARSFLSGEGSIDARKQAAVIDVADAKLLAEVADQQVRAQKEAVKAINVRIDVGRTMSATIRSEIALSGSGMTP